jgi:hypothetical protein
LLNGWTVCRFHGARGVRRRRCDYPAACIAAGAVPAAMTQRRFPPPWLVEDIGNLKKTGSNRGAGASPRASAARIRDDHGVADMYEYRATVFRRATRRGNGVPKILIRPDDAARSKRQSHKGSPNLGGFLLPSSCPYRARPPNRSRLGRVYITAIIDRIDVAFNADCDARPSRPKQ